MRDDNAEEVFWDNLEMIENKIQLFYIEFNGVWVENHLHISSSENRNMLSNATCCLDCSKNLHRVVFHHAKSKLTIRFSF